MKLGVIGYNGFIGNNLINSEFDDYEFLPINLDPDWHYMINFMCFSDFDVIINAAGSANVKHSFEEPAQDFQSNVLLVLYLLECIRRSNSNTRFVNFSSAAVYGIPYFLPIKNSAERHPISPYGYHKLISEDLLRSYFENFKIPTISLRIFSCYGNNNKKQVLWDICSQIVKIRNSELLLQGNSDDTRDFIHVTDMIKQLILILGQDSLFDSRSINIGNGVEVKIGSIAKMLALEFGLDNVKFTGNSISGYPSKWVADISEVKSLGYRSTISIKVGVKMYCDWFKSYISQ